MRSQYMLDSVDNLDFHLTKTIASHKLSRLILEGSYTPGRSVRVLVEKSKGLCRQIVIPHVYDAIVLQCLSDAFYAQVKGKAPSKNAFFEQKDHSFSQKDLPYGTFGAWLRFQQTLFNFSKSKKFIIVTDIANYYDSISYIHLRNSLSCLSGVDESVIDMLIFVLSSLLWQPDYSPRVEIGLPQMNLDAPRVMAHCLLYELDGFLSSQKDVEFARFMDDIDVGVDSIKDAKEILKCIDLILQAKQIRLNSGKTRIMTSSDAYSHFCIYQNAFLDAFVPRVETKLSAAAPLIAEKAKIRSRILTGLSKGVFDHGNGEKVLKRWMTLATKTGTSIPPGELYSMFLLRPSIRTNVLRSMQAKGYRKRHLSILNQVALSGQIVDEAAWLDTTNSLLGNLFKSKNNIGLSNFDPQTYFGFYLSSYLLSRTFQTEALLELIMKYYTNWRLHPLLGRLVASFLPQFTQSGLESELVSIATRSGNQGALDILNFYSRLESEKSLFHFAIPQLKAQNPSLPLKYIYPKFLTLMVALNNKAVPATSINKLKKDCQFLKDDAFLRQSVIIR